MTKYDDEATAVKQALDAVYENKRTNKKDDISGDYSSDTESYPTVKGAKTHFGTKVTSFSSTTSDANYPSEKLVKTALDTKANGTGWTASKNIVTDSSGALTTEDKPTIPVGEDTDANIEMDGTADAGSSSKFARADHVHPSDTSKASSTHTHGNLSNDGKLGSASGKIVTTGTDGVIHASDSITKSLISDFPSSMTPTAHNQATSTITNSDAFDNILPGESTTLTLTDQAKINTAIDTKIGSLSSLSAVIIVGDISNRPTASVSTMGKLYICTENSKVNVYYSTESSGNYSWVKLDADILDEYSVAWSEVTGKPSSFTPSSHTHGNITNAGAIGSTASLPIITTTDGVLTTGSFGSTSGTFAEGNHTHSGYTSVTDVDNEIEAYLDAIISAYTPSNP